MTIDVGKVVGDSAYEVAVSEGYIGTKAEWLESLKGPNVVSTTTDSNISGLLKGANGKVAQAVAGTDYLVQHQSLAEYRKASAQDVIDATKANASDVYTKTQTDSAISAHHDSSKADASTTYTKTEVDTAIAGHHDASKQDSLVSGSNIKTINNEPIVGSGNLSVGGSGVILVGETLIFTTASKASYYQSTETITF